MSSAERPTADGVAVPGRLAANCSIMFKELPLLERPAAARRAGFRAVEFWWPFAEAEPAASEVDAFVTAVQDADVQLIGLNFFAGDMPGGERGVLSDPARAEEFRRNVPVVVAIGEALGCHAFNALYGNRVEGPSIAEQDEVAIENLGVAARAVAAIGGTVLVEPVSGSAGYPLRTAQDVLDVVARARARHDVANIGFLCDLYHLAVNGDDLDQVIARHGAEIAHVQIADTPGRHEPGTGTMPLQRHLTALQAAGYDGWLALEYVPSTTTEETLGWLTTVTV